MNMLLRWAGALSLLMLFFAGPASAQSPASALSAGSDHVLVHKSPTCGCCVQWVEHLRASGFTVEVRDEANVTPTKRRLGVPPAMASCHTAEVGGYFVEGHVPAADIRRLLTQRPAVRGLAVPGMPAGSPGMELPDGRVTPYTVHQIDGEGTVSDFVQHGQ
ncbi:hypothetical protein DFR29_12110 [Tahibacter aquaticus]|uniref:Metal-binding protein n=1 Tax=Tahibacter aquaticus TaxID=520092 RepID=A0A4R6YM44_9GAMM|nr:DUF411 domain-containing protein [Tahibacter aquaticus]TDR38338.1 hypothetical protein DFR29_12110 [Tahibacter aquaticus]